MSVADRLLEQRFAVVPTTREVIATGDEVVVGLPRRCIKPLERSQAPSASVVRFGPFGPSVGSRAVQRFGQTEVVVRNFKFVVIGLLGVAGLVAGAILTFRRNPRIGSSFVNSRVNPALLRHGLAGRGAAEIATLEHIGRRSGQRRLTLVHPEPTPDGFRILVPLGEHSEWARNVVAAGHCRLQLHDVVFELDEPSMLQPSELEDLPTVVRRLEEYLGFEYVALRRVSSAPASLEAAEVIGAPIAGSGGSLTTRSEATRELVASPSR